MHTYIHIYIQTYIHTYIVETIRRKRAYIGSITQYDGNQKAVCGILAAVRCPGYSVISQCRVLCAVVFSSRYSVVRACSRHSVARYGVLNIALPIWGSWHSFVHHV